MGFILLIFGNLSDMANLYYTMKSLGHFTQTRKEWKNKSILVLKLIHVIAVSFRKTIQNFTIVLYLFCYHTGYHTIAWSFQLSQFKLFSGFIKISSHAILMELSFIENGIISYWFVMNRSNCSYIESKHFQFDSLKLGRFIILTYDST